MHNPVGDGKVRAATSSRKTCDLMSVASYLGSDAESQERQLSIADPIFWWNFDSQQFDRVLIAQARAIADGLTLVTIHR